jgi:uncharacterized membrane protein
MKVRILRFSPHQNAKVIAILMAVSSLIFAVPMMVITGIFAPKEAGFPFTMTILIPFFYLIFGYISVAISCLVYNLLAKYTGGIEFENQHIDEV